MDDTEKNEPKYSYWLSAMRDATGAWAERRRLAKAMRAVIDRLVTSDAPEDELRRAAEALERYAERLATHPQRYSPAGFAETANAGDVNAFFDYSPLIGLCNPLAPPVVLRVEGDVVHGTVTFGAAYEGPPGHVHGGLIAATFDEVLGFAQSMTGHPGMTGTLAIRYRKPTPLYQELALEGRVVRVEGRKIMTEGRMYVGETLTAEAEGTFISVDFAKMQALVAAAERRDPARD
jgi:acyl-coenzyme A thioesterase PaaI-like protein